MNEVRKVSFLIIVVTLLLSGSIFAAKTTTKIYTQQAPLFIGYWLGYAASDAKGYNNIGDIPSYVDVVPVAFALLREKNEINMNFILSTLIENGKSQKDAKDKIIAEMKKLKQKNPNVKILVSVGGWAGNCWELLTTQKEVAALSKNIAAVVTEWGFDGVDLDFEGDRKLDPNWPLPIGCKSGGDTTDTVKGYIIQSLRSDLDDKVLTIVTTQDWPYIQENFNLINWVTTMDYNSGTTAYDNLSATYNEINPGADFCPVGFGINNNKGGYGYRTVAEITTLINTTTPSKGTFSLMFWNLSQVPKDNIKAIYTAVKSKIDKL